MTEQTATQLNPDVTSPSARPEQKASSASPPKLSLQAALNQRLLLDRFDHASPRELLKELFDTDLTPDRLVRTNFGGETMAGELVLTIDPANCWFNVTRQNIGIDSMQVPTTDREQGIITQVHAAAVGYTTRQFARNAAQTTIFGLNQGLFTYDMPLTHRCARITPLLRCLCARTFNPGAFGFRIRAWPVQEIGDRMLNEPENLPPEDTPVFVANTVDELIAISYAYMSPEDPLAADGTLNVIIVGRAAPQPGNFVDYIVRAAPQVGEHPIPQCVANGNGAFQNAFLYNYAVLTEHEQLLLWLFSGPAVRYFEPANFANRAATKMVWPSYSMYHAIYAWAANPNPVGRTSLEALEDLQGFAVRLQVFKTLVVNRALMAMGFSLGGGTCPLSSVPAFINERVMANQNLYNAITYPFPPELVEWHPTTTVYETKSVVFQGQGNGRVTDRVAIRTREIPATYCPGALGMGLFSSSSLALVHTPTAADYQALFPAYSLVVGGVPSVCYSQIIPVPRLTLALGRDYQLVGNQTLEAFRVRSQHVHELEDCLGVTSSQLPFRL